MVSRAAVRKRRVTPQTDARTTSQIPLYPMTDRHSLTYKDTPASSSQSSSPGHLSSSSNPGSSATRMPSTPSATAVVTEDAASSADPVNKSAIIVGVVLGVVIVAITLWLVYFCVKRRRKRIRDEATKPEQEHWLPGQGYPEPNQGLGIYPDQYYSAALDASNTAENKQVSSGTVSRDMGHIGRKIAPHSPWSFVLLSKRDGPVHSSDSSPNNGGLYPSPTVPSELSAEPSPKAELSPNPEALEINRSRTPDQETPTTDGHPSPRRPREATKMRSNLEVSDDEDRRRGSHVLSWMSYGNGAAGPTIGGASVGQEQ
ncbi:MAG: hypothetical protein Q9209_005241 [Squamulea sp. 1 TL-2023]